jgi:hypothetical protein
MQDSERVEWRLRGCFPLSLDSSEISIGAIVFLINIGDSMDETEADGAEEEDDEEGMELAKEL